MIEGNARVEQVDARKDAGVPESPSPVREREGDSES
jgi:hypothetical protein